MKDEKRTDTKGVFDDEYKYEVHCDGHGAVAVVFFRRCPRRMIPGNKQTSCWSLADGTSDTFYPAAINIITLDSGECKVRVVNFDMGMPIYADTPQAGEGYIPMSFLWTCEPDAIVSAFETTYGIAIDRYLFLSYEYGSFEPMVSLLDILCPITLDIPQELMGDTQ